jgi:hypothetical protein
LSLVVPSVFCLLPSSRTSSLSEETPPMQKVAGAKRSSASDPGGGGSALEDIHRRFLRGVHKLPIITTPQQQLGPAVVASPIVGVNPAAEVEEEELRRPVSLAGTRRSGHDVGAENTTAGLTTLMNPRASSSMSITEKRVHLESLKRKRIALMAALKERRCLQQCASTTLRHDLAAQRARQNELVRRPYLRYLVDSLNVNPRDGSLAILSARKGGRRRNLRLRHRRAVDLFSESILLNDPAVTLREDREEDTRLGQERTVGGQQAIDSSSSSLGQPSTAVHRASPAIAPALPPNGAAAAAEAAETDVATARSAARMLRMASSSYLLLAGISLSLEDDGRVLALKFDPRSSSGHAAAEANDANDEDDAATGDCATDDEGLPAPSICCAFLQFVTAVAASSIKGPSTTPNDRPVYYVRLQSHTFPTPLVPRVMAILGQVRVGPMTGASTEDHDSDDDQDDDDTSSDEGGGSTDAFLRDLGRRCRDMHRHLLAYHARQKFVAQLLAMDKRSQKKAARRRSGQPPPLDIDARSQGLASGHNDPTSQRQVSRRTDDGDLEDVMSDNSFISRDEAFDNTDDDDDEYDDDRTETSATTAVAEEVTDASVPYHHVNHIVVNDQKISFRLTCKFASTCAAPPPPKLVVKVLWPEHQALASPRRVSIAYHQSRSNRIRESDTVRAAAERERRRREELRHRRRPDSPIDPALGPEDDVAASAAMAISSDEDEELDDSARRFGSRVRDVSTAGKDPYLAALQQAACAAFAYLSMRSALDRLVSKMKELVEECDESA